MTEIPDSQKEFAEHLHDLADKIGSGERRAIRVEHKPKTQRGRHPGELETGVVFTGSEVTIEFEFAEPKTIDD